MKTIFMIGFTLGMLTVLGQACTSTVPTSFNSQGSSGLPNYNGGLGNIPGPGTGTTSSGLQTSSVVGTWVTGCGVISDPTYGQYRQKEIVTIGSPSSNADGTSVASSVQVTVINANLNDTACASGSQVTSSGTLAMNPQGYGNGEAAVNMQLTSSSAGQQTFYDLLGYDGTYIYFGLRSSTQTSAQSPNQRPTQINTSIPFARGS